MDALTELTSKEYARLFQNENKTLAETEEARIIAARQLVEAAQLEHVARPGSISDRVQSALNLVGLAFGVEVRRRDTPFRPGYRR